MKRFAFNSPLLLAATHLTLFACAHGEVTHPHG